MIEGKIYNIMVGSPSDVSAEAEVAIKVIHNWNSLHSSTHGIAVVPIHWRTSSYPTMDEEGQKAINHQLVDESDVMVCIFGSRLGTPTSTHISGTVEEIEAHIKAKKNVLLFIKKFVSPDDIKQYVSLKEYIASVSQKCLYAEFNNLDDFEKVITEKLGLYIEKRFLKKRKEEAITKLETVYSDEEKNIMQQWCKTNIETFSRLNFIGGNSMFRFGSFRVDTKTIREKASMEDFLSRLERDGYILPHKMDKHGNWIYKLTIKAIDRFNLES